MPKLAGVIHSAHLSPKNYPQFRKGQYPPTQLEPLGQGSEVSRPSAMQHVSPLFATDLQEGVRTERSVEKCTKAGTCVKCHVKMFAFYLFLGSQKQRCAFFFVWKAFQGGNRMQNQGQLTLFNIINERFRRDGLYHLCKCFLS